MSDIRSKKPLLMSGLYTATVTPFNPDMTIDRASLEKHLAETFASEGVDGVVINSGAGESWQLTEAEKIEALKLASRFKKPNQLIIAGVESHTPDIVVEQGLAAKKAGADVLLVFPPFDRRPYRRLASVPEAVRGFFSKLDREIDLPMIVYQYPKFVGCSFSMESLLAIADLKNVVAMKTAVQLDFDSYKEIHQHMHDKISLLAGVDTPVLYDILKYGVHGALIGISALYPARWAEFVRLAIARDPKAEEMFKTFCRPLMEGVYEDQKQIRTSSTTAATKEALRQMGKIGHSVVRPPALATNAKTQGEIADCLQSVGLLSKAAAE